MWQRKNVTGTKVILHKDLTYKALSHSEILANTCANKFIISNVLCWKPWQNLQ